MSRAVAGAPALGRLALRRDRVVLPVWVLSIGAYVLVTASSFQSLYPSEADRAKLAASIAGNSALQAITGRAYDLTTVGGLTSWRATGTVALLAALMSMFLTVRHTRAEEESGRSELLATTVGRHAWLAAGVVTVAAADLAAAAVVALGLVALGLPPAGSAAMGLAIGLAGLVTAGVAAVMAQVASTGRGANGLTGVAVGVFFVLRVVGDIGVEGAGWLTPLGLAERVRPFAHERWWVLLVLLAVAAALLALAGVLAAHRDHGSGLRQQQPGPASAGTQLAGAGGLAWRLQRGVLLGWAAGFFLLGLAVGAIASDVGDFASSSQQIEDILHKLGGRAAIVDVYIASILGLAGLVAGAYGVQAVLRLHAEEASGRAEVVLATRTSRARWAAGHVAVAAAGVVAVLAATGLGLGVAHGLRTHSLGEQVPRLVGAALAQAPAALVLVGAATLLHGLSARLATWAWLAVGFCVAMLELAPLVDLPSWVLGLSPYHHVPKLPSASLDAGAVLALLVLLLVAALLAAGGLLALRRRDIG